MSDRSSPVAAGQRYGSLTVLEGPPTKGKNTQWQCRCDCGGKKMATTSHLRSGAVTSCGCAQQAMRESFGNRTSSHGGSNSLTYDRWRSMRARCLLPNSKSYPDYGGRGITICERWDSYENFLQDMGPCPGSHMTLERTDSNGNYEASNCIWADRTTQNRNTSRNVRLAHDGRTLCVSEWAEILGLNMRTILSRLARGDDTARALRPAEPARRYYPRRQRAEGGGAK